LNKIASEEARVAATEKARLAEEEKARLRAEGAKQAEQAKAAAQAKAAEDARLAAEKAKQVQQEKMAVAEQARAAAEKLAADKLAEQKSAAEKLAAERAETAAAAKAAAQKADAEKPPAEAKPEQRVASLPPSDNSAPRDALPAADIVRSVHTELRRVGCLTGAVDGEWAASSRRALGAFNRNAGTKFDVKVASLDALDAIKAKPTRICPLTCERGYKAEGERCTRIACRPGYEVGDNNTCEKIEVKKPTAKREEPNAKRELPERPKAETPAKSQTSGQILCGGSGCRPMPKNCYMPPRAYAGANQQRYSDLVCR